MRIQGRLNNSYAHGDVDTNFYKRSHIEHYLFVGRNLHSPTTQRRKVYVCHLSDDML
jgi:hypothetical protein